MGKAVTKEVWIAEDGEEFSTKEEMLWYEAKASYDSYIDEFIGSLDMEKDENLTKRGIAQKVSRTRNEISAFCEYLAGQGVVLVEDTATG